MPGGNYAIYSCSSANITPEVHYTEVKLEKQYC